MKFLIRATTLCVRIFFLRFNPSGVQLNFNDLTYSVTTWYNEGLVSLFRKTLMMFVNLLQVRQVRVPYSDMATCSKTNSDFVVSFNSVDLHL